MADEDRRPENLALVVPVLDLRDADVPRWSAYAALPFVDEVIVVRPAGASPASPPIGPDVRVLEAPLGRASQMNAGALATRAALLFFLHGDTHVQPRALAAARNVLRAEDVAVALSLRFDSDRRSYRILERLSRLRNRILPSPLGDQGLAMRRRRFLELGGFPDQPLCEDLVMSRRLRRRVGFRILPEVAVTSPARFERRGLWRTFGHNVLLVARHALGASPRTLVRRYYGPDYLTRWLAADPRRRGGPSRAPGSTSGHAAHPLR